MLVLLLLYTARMRYSYSCPAWCRQAEAYCKRAVILCLGEALISPIDIFVDLLFRTSKFLAILVS
jgi:hypothetical protein